MERNLSYDVWIVWIFGCGCSNMVAGLRLRITEKFSSIISYENTYDSSPPQNTDESNSFYGIKFSFEY